MDIIIVIYNPPPNNPKTCTGYAFDEATHPGGKFHDSGTSLVLQVTNAGVRRPGYEAMLVYQDIQGLWEMHHIPNPSYCFSNEALSAWAGMRLHQLWNEVPSAWE